MKDDMRIIGTEKELKIFSDPYRMKIIRAFQQSDVPLTVKNCADIMGEVPAKVHYHVKKLESIDILVLDHTKQVNGITAKYYRLPKRSFSIHLTDPKTNEMMRNLDYISSMVSNMFEEFKINLSKAQARAAKMNHKHDYEAGILAGSELFLTEDEFRKVRDTLIDIQEHYKKPKEGTRKYTFIGGVSYIVEDKK